MCLYYKYDSSVTRIRHSVVLDLLTRYCISIFSKLKNSGLSTVSKVVDAVNQTVTVTVRHWLGQPCDRHVVFLGNGLYRVVTGSSVVTTATYLCHQ